MKMNDMVLALIIILPLAGYLLLRFAGKHFPRNSGGILASVLVGLSFFLSLFAFLTTGHYGPFHTGPFTWIETSGFSASFGLQADSLTLVMMLMISGVSALIHVYSIGYMQQDKDFNQFFAYLNLFVFFMLLLVAADNYLLLFAGWEGVGLCSYLLIGFWFRNAEYARAANKAFIMNRIGDIGFLLGMATMYLTFGSLSFSGIQSQLLQGTGINQMTLITVFLFIGAIGKSAQIPLFTWLPDAMAGPTPVSALIHAATMVTAGVYLIIRSKALFILSPLTMDMVSTVGIVTALFAGSIALKQNDIKKILAYSTISQLGLMFFALGLGAFDASLFHLLTHAFFKALLFLCAGSVIHALHGQQDIRFMGGMRAKIPITQITMLVGALAISGIPPFSGFFSKDGILAAALLANPLLWFLGVAVSILTAFYMFRLIVLVFYGHYRGDRQSWDDTHESPGVMTIPLIVLAFLSITGGVINIPELFGGEQWLSDFTGMKGLPESHGFTAEWIAIIITVLAVSLAIWITIVFFQKRGFIPASEGKQRAMGKLLTGKYYVDEIYTALVIKPLTWLSDKLYSVMELKVVDGVVEGVGSVVIALSRIFRYLQSGSVSFYLLFMVLGIILVLIFNLFF
jgi:NADH-quinone oxidoreductase subunit L